ncbi:MAG TPA: hypothetical protein DHW71_03910 [Gammaproteobacteria bacterium]|nr:hypothetical protein [Gammaproteobacteria bacterium]HBF09261.1 hypothetical protein [Gammaproteobacteria bacterium]HCK92105.1 hypothetical protein [Gammaproteobacteria bacterium]|tara:strand:- start:350 stop:1036 length:687 start_codon:yes stop_codon:yes gene_type:complete
MSFILDAVKKSEQERRLAQSENLQSWYYQPVGKPEKKTPWVAVLVVMNTLVLIALFIVVLKPSWLSTLRADEPAVAQETHEPSKPSNTNSDAVNQDSSTYMYDDINAPEIISPSGGITVSGEYSSQEEEVILPSVRRSVQQVQLPQGPVVDLEELPESVVIHIPAIGFSSHLYSSAPEARQVVVNGQKLHEGDYLNQDLQLLKIEEKSVIFQQFQYPFRVYVARYWVK